MKKFLGKPAAPPATTQAKPRSKPWTKDKPQGETVAPKRPPLTPSPSFSSARERRERGIDEDRFLPPSERNGEDDVEKYLNAYYARRYS